MEQSSLENGSLLVDPFQGAFFRQVGLEGSSQFGIGNIAINKEVVDKGVEMSTYAYAMDIRLISPKPLVKAKKTSESTGSVGLDMLAHS